MSYPTPTPSMLVTQTQGLEVVSSETEEQWFALLVRSRHEKVVSAILRSRGYEELLPLCRALHRWADRNKVVELPLFAGYVFCRFQVASRNPVLAVPGVVSIVSRGKTPAPVEPSEILSLQRILASGHPLEECEYLSVGQRVMIAEGALAGVQGFIVQVRKSSRLVVSVSLLQRSVSVEIDSYRVVPCDDEPPLAFKAACGQGR
jgi:transcription antitermination factor NusG